MLIDIDLQRDEQLILVNRPDGSSTVSVPLSAFERVEKMLAILKGGPIRTTHQAERAD